MIRVVSVPEPPDFDEKVRQPGLDAIAELVGEEPPRKRPGPRRAKVAERRGEIPPDVYPTYWRSALDDLMEAYRRICAYMSIYIEPVTGSPTVDHMIPKSRAWNQVYEWSNFRLACALMNARKGAVAKVLDPFEIEDSWFVLELTGFQVTPGDGLEAALQQQAAETIDRLKLNHPACRGVREEYAVNYWEGHISLAYLNRRAPFLGRELGRQGRLLAADT